MNSRDEIAFSIHPISIKDTLINNGDTITDTTAAITNGTFISEPYQIYFAYARPWTTALTAASLLLNSLVVAILLHQRKTHHQSWGQLHLLFLAGSDLSITAVYGWGCAWGYYQRTRPILEDPLQDSLFFVHWTIWAALWALAIGTNRWLTLYITAAKARAVRSLRSAMKMLDRTPKRVLKVTELV